MTPRSPKAKALGHHPERNFVARATSIWIRAAIVRAAADTNDRSAQGALVVPIAKSAK
jgi:hypothetical protein